MRVARGKRAGRGHRTRNVVCQDASAVLEQPEQGRVAVAVADGLGTRPRSDVGSQVACEEAVRALGEEATWDREAVLRAFTRARAAVEAKALELGVPAGDLGTTLQVAAATSDRVVAGIVGDGAVVACTPTPTLLLSPQDFEYANEVCPITEPRWAEFFRFAETPAAKSLLVFTDGLTRLLLKRQKRAWEPFLPFYEAFLPRLEPAAFDADLVTRFLETDKVDASWDDDKCLVVVGLDGAPG